MTNKKQVYNNQSGFIELEYLMAAAIGLIVIAAFATGLSQMSNLQRRNDIAQDSAMLVEDLSNAFKSGDFCTQLMSTFSLPASANTVASVSIPYNIGSGNVTLAAGQEIQPGLFITKMDIVQNAALPVSTVVTKTGTYEQHSVVLRVGTKKVVNGQDTPMRDRDIPMLLSTVPGSGLVKYCNTDSLAAQACYQSGGTYNESANPALGQTHCLPANHCDYGGTFSNDPTNGFSNPLTGFAGCPAGYIPERTGTVSRITTAAKYTAVSNSYYGISTCMRCGPTLVAQAAGVQDSITDLTSLASIPNTINGVPTYQSSMAGHITTTAQAAAAAANATPIPTPIPATPTPAPTAMPTPSGTPAPQCDGSTQYYPASQVSQPTDCVAGTTPQDIPVSDGMGGFYSITMCACNNYGTSTPTPTPTPAATPSACQGWIDQYQANNGGAGGLCGGTFSCIGNGTAVKENCGDGSWYTSSAGGAAVLHDPGCGHCFAEGSLVTLADGSTKPIESMKVGDQVLSYDESTDSPIVTTVMKPIRHEPRMHLMHDFTLDNGRVIRATDKHPIFVFENHDYALTKEVAALVTLGVKVSLLDQSGRPVRIRSVRTYKERLPTYNLSVDGVVDGAGESSQGLGHNYYIEGALVHNKQLCHQ
jgi:hypothetical protein